MGTIYKSPTDSLRLEFLEEFQNDLRRIGNKVTIKYHLNNPGSR